MRRSTRSSGVSAVVSKAARVLASRFSAVISVAIPRRRKVVEQVVVLVQSVSGGDRRVPPREVVEVPVDKSGE